MQFPTPYEGELLYSVISRYHIRSGNISWLHTLEDLFGKRTTNATALLPSNIHAIVERLPKNSTLNEKLLIENHTMYNFYTAFLQKKQVLEIYQSILSEDGKTIYMRAGIMSSAITQNKYFHYCSKCLQESGEMYWDRLQQLPGKLICLKHGIWLEASSVPLIQQDKCSYVLPNRDNCNLDLVRSVGESLKEEYFQLLDQVQVLLNTPSSRQYSYSEWTSFYRQKLIENGYANRNGRVNQIKLNEDFFHYYSKEFLLNLGIDTTYWLRVITQKHRKSFHPYYHILFLNFLGLTVNDLFIDSQIEGDSSAQTTFSCSSKICEAVKEENTFGNMSNKKAKNDPEKIEKLKQKRQIWLQIQKQHPKIYKTELRKAQPSIYAYLYRYDRNWLNENSPKCTKRKVVNNRVDWQKRDREVLAKVMKATHELLDRQEDLRRITIKSLGDETGELALLDKQLNKLPETKAYIDKVKESVDRFRKRRVEHVIERMRGEEEQIKEWKVLREAGISSKYHDEFRIFIHMYINSFNEI
ncbi:TnsD family transposase [Ureibacillus chungkukjangi]|uniref:TnsD family Tn7-like transposition protein n=1 Tax=Ureibacillus chungkukjangi TaxID=1202712 RepID=UPI0025594FDF|nr:TnsD family Tn7-like transposition protein [Ureibacillus chungkukjangi]MCM3390601.1 TnsD family transposase [Ureibacillus chungkukjangi]